MKRSVALAGALLIMGLVFAAPAQGHGTCTAKANPPAHPSNMTFSGYYRCTGVSYHDYITITVLGDRRTPGGSWNLVASGGDTERITNYNFHGLITSVPYDCHKDYRTRVQASAQPGGHSGSNTSSILTHTC